MSTRSWVDLIPLPDPNMSKRSMFSVITPLPSTVSRATAVAFLHEHKSMIEMNPLVLRHVVTTPPPNATEDERDFMIWYAITDEIIYIPGTSVKSETTYKAGFFNTPKGLQTHVFAPAGVDIQAKWTVGGNMAGEPREPLELGIDKPKDGLYLREDVDLRCNILLMGFVKRNLKKSHLEMVDKMMEKITLQDQSSSQLSRADTWKSSHSDSSTLQRRSSNFTPQDSNPQSHSSSQQPMGSSRETTLTPRQPSPDTAGCSCIGSRHMMGCTHYSRTYQPPFLYTKRQIRAQEPQSSIASSAAPTNGHPTKDETSCHCDGAVHLEVCPAYSSMRSATFPAAGLSAQSFQSSPNLFLRPHSLNQVPPQRPVSVDGSTFRPQGPGEQAELPGSAFPQPMNHRASWVNRSLKPDHIRTQSRP